MFTPLNNCCFESETCFWTMKPASYHGMSSPLNSGYPALDHVLSLPKVMHCEKCGFASTDALVFKKHMNDHAGTRFYCFYCNNVFFSEAELNTHMKKHAAKYPFKCPHCGQGYMRRLCLVKHIDRLHGNGMNYGPDKPGTAKIPQVSVSSASPSVPTADPSSIRPVVRVKVPASSSPGLRQGKDEQREKTPDTNVSRATNGNAELLSPSNGLSQHNRALTVSLPEEVSIPAGCLVELVEVKTVNGTKELKLRLISQQENESVIKDTRSTVSQNSAPPKQISTFNHPNTAKSGGVGMCSVAKKQYKTKTINVESPSVFPGPKNLPNQMSNNKVGLKRPNQEVINLECNTVLPNKVPKSLNTAREGNNGVKISQREPVNHKVAADKLSVNLTRAVNRLPSTLPPQSMGACVSQRAMDERINLTLDHSKTVPPRGANSRSIVLRDVSSAVKLEPCEDHLKKKTSPVGIPSPAAAQIRPPALSVHENTITNVPFSVPRTLSEPVSFKSPVLSNRLNSKISQWNKEVRSEERSAEGDMQEPESFPVISSVFSLSQQPEEVQGSMQPLVMALRGIVMDKSNSSVVIGQDHIKMTNGTVQVKEMPTRGNPSQVKVPASSSPGNSSQVAAQATQTNGYVKLEEHQKGYQHLPALTHSSIKKENNNTMPSDNNTCNYPPDSKSSQDMDSVSKIVEHVDACASADTQLQVATSDNDMPSKFLTVSLKRVQLGIWKKNKKGIKRRISKYKTQVSMGSLTDCTAIYPMPLKVDQLVKRPGPDQPVVVLNHPKPRAAMQGARADTPSDTGTSEVVPKCQILKMRLSKVMGQKYEVMGCTVGVFP